MRTRGRCGRRFEVAHMNGIKGAPEDANAHVSSQSSTRLHASSNELGLLRRLYFRNRRQVSPGGFLQLREPVAGDGRDPQERQTVRAHVCAQRVDCSGVGDGVHFRRRDDLRFGGQLGTESRELALDRFESEPDRARTRQRRRRDE